MNHNFEGQLLTLGTLESRRHTMVEERRPKARRGMLKRRLRDKQREDATMTPHPFCCNTPDDWPRKATNNRTQKFNFHKITTLAAPAIAL